MREITVETQADDSVSTVVVEAVAEAVGVDATALPPLYERVDPDALDAVFAPTATGAPRTGEIQFSYSEYVVTVGCDGDEIAITLDT
ncbi:uncharacterized protein Nmag_2531 [Natrialba magadii ATCC 43099]|uniref:Halobacterial output domain-containing protein n=1 Tax=Natrialba magadii (strain ATCC 43099 / DSM 3394 / CCM 3739 / CIP 104546 / IAM 13178 / JCM 8861 / NBRC 102185 / NCIMB 2190 / MS3) TaxID=547559 RepID=D3SYC0_NATMM|nr:HalOD1 output domain-containing protein [Natrialba magadii]ADD06091.1 uncharacterized protein Nmag_2531 [Natrialba magadii ATCC 43099]ELY30912.1 hypothetical protein C500_07738 [Natrialba magadii ATCC 43099]